jgi:SAM-dependent methyltransferase/glycosyltransferase involved in cell wall biosynthesis
MEKRKVRIAHFAAFCPQRTGQYATVKDMIQAERSVGLDAQFVATSVNAKRVAGFSKEEHKDGWLTTVGEEWAKKADIYIRHSCIPDRYKNLGVPIIMALHGRPESTFLIEYGGLMKIYKMISEARNDYRYKGWITFWQEHEFFHSMKVPEDRLFYVPAMVDLEEYKPEGVKVKFEKEGGKPNIIIADMWRHDMTPYTMLYAAALFQKKYCPEAKVQIFGVPEKKADSVIILMKQNGVIGNMMHCVKPMSNVYRGGDFLITPHGIATRIVRESLACGLPIVAGTTNKYTPYTADPRDIEAFAKQMNRCWENIKKSNGHAAINARKKAEREFSIKKAGEAVRRACISILRKEVEGWDTKEKVSFRKYADYKDYVSQQSSKMKNAYAIVSDNYKEKYRKSLSHRLDRMAKKTKRLEKGMSVLCLGARDGTEVRAFHDAGYFAVGVDLFPVSSEYVLKGDFQKLHYPENSLDIVFMNCVDHVYDLDKLLEDVVRILKPNGLFLVDFSQIADPSHDRWASCKWKSLQDIGLYIRKRGFTVEVITTFNDGYFTNMICYRSMGGLSRADIINSYIKKHNFKDYLEIGSKTGETFNRIKCRNKTSVDPHYDSDFRMTSDKFFEQCNSDKFDIVFIDGLHSAKQVYRDINNSLKHLTKNGVVLVHDCNPVQEYLQDTHKQEIFENDNWCGDGWKAIAKVRMTRDDLTTFVIDRDYGVGVIYKGGQTVYADNKEIDELDWEYLKENRKELLRLREPAGWIAKT